MKRKYTGISRVQKTGKYKAVLYGQYLGCYDSESEAARFVDLALLELNAPNTYWKLNFPEEQVAPSVFFCDKCREEKDISSLKCPPGRRQRQLVCYQCVRAAAPRMSGEQQKERKYANVTNYFRSIHSHIKNRCKKTNIEYDITAQDLINMYQTQNQRCKLSNMRMEIQNQNKKIAPSVDRINPKGGYTLDNIQLVCWIVNVMKSDNQEEEFIKICHCISKQNRKQTTNAQETKWLRCWSAKPDEGVRFSSCAPFYTLVV